MLQNCSLLSCVKDLDWSHKPFLFSFLEPDKTEPKKHYNIAHRVLQLIIQHKYIIIILHMTMGTNHIICIPAHWLLIIIAFISEFSPCESTTLSYAESLLRFYITNINKFFPSWSWNDMKSRVILSTSINFLPNTTIKFFHNNLYLYWSKFSLRSMKKRGDERRNKQSTNERA